MKKINKSSFGRMARLTTIVAAIMTITGFVGCGNKSSNSSQNQNVTPYGTCSNCQNFSGAEIARPVSNQAASVQASFQVLGDQTIFSQISNQTYGNPMYYYQGPLVLRGGITISTKVAQYCQIPAGQYTINTLQQGSKTVGSALSFPSLEAINGNVRILLSAQFYLQSTSQFSNDLVGEGTYIFQSVQISGGQTISCNNLTWATNY